MAPIESNLQISPSTPDDIEEIMEIYERAKTYMRREGNMSQWTGGYPSADKILSDIEAAQHFSCRRHENGELMMVFSFIIGPDPTYAVIEEGEWLNDAPYGTVHRIASAGKQGGMVEACVDFCSRYVSNLRIDTHADNLTMQRALGRLGFKQCGIIYTEDGSPRIAFQKEFAKQAGLDATENNHKRR